MSSSRATFTPKVVTALFGILPEYVTPSGKKIVWQTVAEKLNNRTGQNIEYLSLKNWFTYMKERRKAWNEIKSWTGIGWTQNSFPEVDLAGDKWKGFAKQYKSIAKGFLKNPLENEVEWDKILHCGYATGQRSYTPSSVVMKQKEVLTVDLEKSDKSDESLEFKTPNTDYDTPNFDIEPFSVPVDPKKRKGRLDNISQQSKKSYKCSREEDINVCLNQMKKSSVSQTSAPKNTFNEVQNLLEAMGIVDKDGEEFVVDILDSFRLLRVPSTFSHLCVLTKEDFIS